MATLLANSLVSRDLYDRYIVNQIIYIIFIVLMFIEENFYVQLSS